MNREKFDVIRDKCFIPSFNQKNCFFDHSYLSQKNLEIMHTDRHTHFDPLQPKEIGNFGENRKLY